jgi:hypothetical protein
MKKLRGSVTAVLSATTILLLRHVTCWWPAVHAKSLVDTIFFLQGLGLGAVRVGQGREGDRVAGRKAVKQLESCVGG